jgi:trigger factor
MEVNHIVNENLTAIITVKVTEPDYHDEVAKVLNDYRRKATIPGFRPGHVPAGLVKKMYGDAILADTISKLLGDNLDKYLTDNQFKTLGQPLPIEDDDNIVDFKNFTNFDFRYEVGLKPDFDLEIDHSMKLEFYNIDIAEDAVDKYLLDMRRRLGNRVDADQPSEGDTIYGSIIEVDANGDVLEGGLNLENKFMSVDYIKLKGVKSDFLKLKKGESIIFNPAKAFKNEVELSYLLGIGLNEAKDFKADVKFTLTDVKHFELAEINEELFTKVYEHDNISSEEQLRERILQDVTQTYKNEARNQFMNEMVDMLLEKTNLQLPDEFLKRWILENNRREKDDQRITPEELEAQYDNYRDTLRWQIVEEKLTEKYGLRVTLDEIKARIGELMGFQIIGEMDEQTKAIIDQVTDSVMKNSEETNRIANQITENKLHDLFRDKANIKEKNISYDDFVKMVSEKAAEKATKK